MRTPHIVEDYPVEDYSDQNLWIQQHGLKTRTSATKKKTTRSEIKSRRKSEKLAKRANRHNR